MSPPELTTGQIFGPYRLGDLVGRGGMGVVRRAEHVHLGRMVALKLLAPELSGNAEFRDRFLRESRLAAALDHPNIITVYDAGEVDGVLYLAMRFVSGSDLSAEIASRGPLSPDESVELLAQVGSALDAAHAAGLVHRDVKPANVMLDGGRAYLTDFGLTKQSTSGTAPGLTQSGIFLGTVDYAAPEQIEGKPVDARTDVYALGCVLHECLTASRPFPRDSQVAVLYAHLHEDPPSPCSLRPDLPSALDAVIAAAMAKRPAERYSSCGELMTAAREALTGVSWAEPTGVRPPETRALPPEADPPTSQLAPSDTSGSAERRTRQGAPEPTGLQAPDATHARAVPATSRPVPRADELAPRAEAPVAPKAEAPVAPKERSRLPVILGSLAATALVAILVAVFALGGDDDPGGDTGGDQGGAAGAPADQGGGDDEGGGGEARVVGDPIPVGERPFGVVVGDGVVWVANNSADTVTRQADDGGLRTDLDVGSEPFGLARNRDSVWVANAGDGTVSRINVETGEVQEPVKVGEKPYFLTADEASVFVSNGESNTVTQLNAETGQPVGQPIAVGNEPRGIATSGSAVWVANRADGTVSRIVGGTVVREFEVGENPVMVAFGADAIWVANRDSNTVTRIDVRAGGDFEQQTIEVGREPFGVAFGEGSVWVTNTADNTVTRIDPESGEVIGDPIPVPGQPVGISAARGFVWVTSNDTNTLTKIDPGN